MTVVELAKSLSDKAIRELMKIGANSKAAAPARVKALELILDRAWGRPTPVVPVSAVPPPLSYPDEIENARRILFALDLAGRRKREMEVEALPPPVPKDILDEVPPAEVLKPKDDDMAVRFAAAHDVSCLREMSPSSGSPKVVKGRNRRH